MSAASTATTAAPVLVLRKSDRGAMVVGGTVTFEVYRDGVWVGWVGDERPFSGGVRRGGRRWWACWRQDGDQHARWRGDDHRTRTAAVAALLAEITRTRR